MHTTADGRWSRVRKRRRHALSVLVARVLVACVSPGWTVYVYNNRTTSVIVRFSANGHQDTRMLGADQQGFIYVGPSRPGDAVVTFVDPSTCGVLGTAENLPSVHPLIVFSHDDNVGVGVDDPGSQTRTLVPTTTACP